MKEKNNDNNNKEEGERVRKKKKQKATTLLTRYGGQGASSRTEGKTAPFSVWLVPPICSCLLPFPPNPLIFFFISSLSLTNKPSIAHKVFSSLLLSLTQQLNSSANRRCRSASDSKRRRIQ